jgi:pimeloyl-ACP methyl ester carboxylesterase
VRRAPERYRAAGGEVLNDGGPAAARSTADMPPLNIFVGGAADASTERVKKYYNDFRDNYDRNARYLSWQDMDGILDAIRGAAPGQRVNIIAHSYGAHTVGLGVGMMAPTGIHVDKLITIDPVGRSLNPGTLRGAVGTWVNVASDASDPNFSDMVATLGGKGGHLPADSADANYTVDTNHGNFAAMMRAPGPGGVSAEELLLGSDLPKPINPRLGETLGGV